MDEIPPEVLADVKTGKISLADVASDVAAVFVAHYELLVSENYQLRVKEEGYSVVFQSLKDGNLVLMTMCLILTLCLIMFTHNMGESDRDDATNDDEEEEKEPPRDFTIEQLRDFDGIKNEKIYIAMRGEVFDVSNAKAYYGVDSSYHCFAGRDASRAMAKLSFDEEELSNQNLDDLGIFEQDVLQNWIDKFKYGKQYPVVGHLSFPNMGDSKRVFTVSELAKYKGIGPSSEVAATADGVGVGRAPVTGAKKSAAVPTSSNIKEDSATTSSAQVLLPGRVHREILMCVRGKVFDVSYGGVDMYGEGGPYHIFAGIDASRALAKMSFDKDDLSSRHLGDLTEGQMKVLDDWEKKYTESRKYPVVGVMADADEAASTALYVIPENMRKSKLIKAAQ